MAEVNIFKLGALLGLLKNKIRLTILRILNENKEGLYFKEIYEKLLERGISIRPTTLVYHLEILGNAKLIKNEYTKSKKGYSLYRISEAGKKALEILEKAEKTLKQ